MRNSIARALWALADILKIVQGGVIALAAKAATSGESKIW